MSSPESSPTLTMNSEAPTSPAVGGSLPAYQLTPRSKIKAMMAAVDDESPSEDLEKDGVVAKHRPTMSARDANINSVKRPEQRQPQPFPEDEDSDQDVSRARGRINQRSGKVFVEARSSGSDRDDDSDKENAYTRVKRRLQSKGAPSRHDDVLNATAGAFPQPAPKNSPRSSSAPILTPDQSTLLTPSDRPQPSPGLFLTPELGGQVSGKHSAEAGAGSSDSDLPADPVRSNKFMELVARKGEEREAKKAKEAARKKKGKTHQGESDELGLGYGSSDESDVGDQDVAMRLTQQDRPARKASKKALEEMSRETQRMSRNMQLAHQAKTKRKITKESFFARFNLGGFASPAPESGMGQFSSTSASSAPASDHDECMVKDTPPTSPLQPDETKDQSTSQSRRGSDYSHEATFAESMPAEVNELPAMVDPLDQPLARLEKGKGKVVDTTNTASSAQKQKPRKYDFKQRPIKIHPPKIPKDRRNANDSDSDLEVIQSKKVKPSRLDAFERVPEVKNDDVRSLRTLRMLAHLSSPPTNKIRRGKPSVSSLDMQKSLQKRARQQAFEERRAKIDDLKARGIIVQTAEEKEQAQVEVEDLLEKARKEDVEIREKERRAARVEKLANGEPVGQSDLSDDDDGDYEVGHADEPDVDLSGSEEEQDDMNLNEGNESNDSENGDDSPADREENMAKKSLGFIEDEASDDESDEADVEADDEDTPDVLKISGQLNAIRRRKNRTILEDDEEEGEQGPFVAIDNSKSPATPAVEVPRLFQGRQNSMPLGMTQAFAATMADTQTQANDSQSSIMPFDSPPEPALPMFPGQDSVHTLESNEDLFNHEETSPALDTADSMFALPIANDSIDGTRTQLAATQYSELPDPTQDAGFGMSSPGPEQRFVSEPSSTVATVILPDAQANESPVAKKRGRLRRRKAVQQTSDDEMVEGLQFPKASGRNLSPDAFAMMKQARKRTLEREQFNKKQSEAKEMVEEQAQESEDEYAGLGGASDEETGGEDDDFVKEMIDQGEVEIDERKLAAFYADKQRTDDDKAIQKLFKDINNGGLRRKRNSEFDLSDSEDDAEARRRRKQRDFAKMRKALLANENVGKIAEDPKKMAFLKAIEDRDDYDDFNFLDRPAADSFRVEMDTEEGEDSQSKQQHPIDESEGAGKTKQTLQETAPNTTNMRPPPSKRRTQAPKKPASLAEIKESVSFLIEDPGAQNIPVTSSSEDDDPDSYVPETQHTNTRRTNANPIIDRLTLKRQSSSSLSATAAGAGAGQMAFHDPSTSMSGNNFVPSLLRRATTSSLNSMTDGSGGSGGHAVTERAAGGGEKDVFRRGGGKRSSVNFSARESQKKVLVEGVERRKKERRERMAKERQGSGGLAVLSRMSTWEG